MSDEEYLLSNGWIKESDNTFTLPSSSFILFKHAELELALESQRYWDWAEREKIPSCS